MKSPGMLAASVLLLLCGLQASALEPVVRNCSEPQAPASVPDGSTADYQAMKTSFEAHKAFNVAGHEYLACLDSNAELQKQAATVAYGFGEKLTQRLRQIDATYLATHNAFVDRLRTVADRFNLELREYKARRTAARAERAPPDTR